MFDKILNNLEYVFGGAMIVACALVGYSLGSDSNKREVCEHVGGQYVKAFNGYKCIMATEITLK